MKRLEANGWKVGNADEFLELTDNEKEVSKITAPTFEYRGYYGYIEVDVENNLLFGRVVDIVDVITFKAETVKQIKIEFAKSIDDYLDFCNSRSN